MARFRDGDLDVIVGTTVVEVGVDVPEATMMVIEGADRFGLAQLHQLRGRVGRGTAESFCVLVSDSTDETAQARLKAVTEIRDGFELAEKDFELRREGDVLGLAQSGLPRLRVASLQDREHVALAKRARDHAERLLDPTTAGSRPDGGAAPPRARARLAAARLGRRTGERRVTATAERPMADAGRVIAGSAKGSGCARPGPGRGRSSDRVKQTLFAILEPELDGRPRPRPVRRAAARAGSRRCRAAPRRRRSSSSDQGAAAVIDANLRAASLGRRPARRSSAGDVAPLARRWRHRRRPVRPRPRRPALRRDGAADARPRDPRRAADAPLAADARVVAKHFWRDRPPERIGMLAAERDRRFGETALTFYRRTEGGEAR